MKDAHARGRSNRRKGADYERELANQIRDTWGYNTRRGRVFDGEPDIVGLPGIHIEAKYQQNLNIQAAMEQAIAAAEKHGGYPAVFHRKPRTGTLVTMRLEDWIDLYGAWKLPFTE